MKRNSLNFWLEVLAFLCLVGLVWTGLLMHHVLPPGIRGGGSHLELWGLNRHDYGEIHLGLGVGFLVLVLAHVLLHWSWVCSVAGHTFRKESSSGISGAAVGLALLLATAVSIAGALWWAEGSIVAADTGFGHGRAGIVADVSLWPVDPHDQGLGGPFLTGSMTLRQAAQATDVDVQAINDALAETYNVPRELRPDDQLGRIARACNVPMHQLRATILEAASRPHDPVRESPPVPAAP